ncbi:MAG: glycosyltransferase [Fimbriimonadaceae bacterium]|nr:glycosyltransferase [Fimbriimonadaceae bacterium]
MKLALVHEWLTNLAGSERVALALHELWPAAPLYTALYAPAALPAAYGPDQLDVRTSWLQQIPGATKRWRHLLPLLPAAFESFDLSAYEVVLSSSHACAKGVVTPAETCHICYCYTPIRYVWEQPHAYLAEVGPLARLVLAPTLRRLRTWDFAAAQRVDRFIAISAAVQQRIAKHYRRDSTVIYPPVDTAQFAAGERQEFYLVVSRLVGYKRVDLAVAACTQLGRRLLVVGSGPEEARLRTAAGPTVEFCGALDDAAVRRLYGQARALLFCGVEDFGLTPVEAQASGCPVIAFRRGGATETVVDQQTGLFFDEPTPASLATAIQRCETREGSVEACQTNARRFDRAVFDQQIRDFVAAARDEHPARLRQEAR